MNTLWLQIFTVAAVATSCFSCGGTSKSCHTMKACASADQLNPNVTYEATCCVEITDCTDDGTPKFNSIGCTKQVQTSEVGDE